MNDDAACVLGRLACLSSVAPRSRSVVVSQWGELDTFVVRPFGISSTSIAHVVGTHASLCAFRFCLRL